MTPAPGKGLLPLIRDLARPDGLGGATDGQLLEWFLGEHREAAFRALVDRHGPMVMSVCRRVLDNDHDAEDAFQAAFLVLARKAAAVRPPGLVANWLYGVAYRTAPKARVTRARAAATRRRAAERLAAMAERTPTEDELWHDLQPVLDQELHRLPDTYRVAVVLCDLEGKSRKEAARQLGWPDGTLSGRLARARKRLAERLARRGVTLSAAVLAAALAKGAASAAVPVALKSTLIRAAVLWAGGSALPGGAVAARVVQLTEGTMKTLLLARLRLGFVCAAAAGLAAAAAGLVAAQVGPARQPAAATAPPAENGAGDKQLAPQPALAKAPAFRISGHVFDAGTGQPIAKCRVVPALFDFDDPNRITWQSQYLKEFTDGRFLYETDRPWNKTRLRIEADGYRPAMTRAVGKAEQSVAIDVRLERGAFTGVVLLPNGQPAAKARVAIASHTNEVTVTSGALSYTGHGKALRKVVEADEQGRFTLPAEIDPSVVVAAHESGYAEVAAVPARNAAGVKQWADSTPPNNQALKLTLRPWGRVEGRILANNKPVVGATYWVSQSRADDVFVWAHQDVVSDADGRFVVDRIPPGPHGQCQRYAPNRDGSGGHAISGVRASFDIAPGGTTTLHLGSPGRTVIGTLALPTGFPHEIDWGKLKVGVSLQPPRVNWGRDGNEAGRSWAEFLQSDVGRMYGRTNVKPAADRSFRIEGLPAADYVLAVSASGAAVVGGAKPDGEFLRGSAEFTIPAVRPAAEPPPIDLGAIKLVSTIPAKDAPTEQGRER
jgi:RNA polymerase sigma factor (sigma-70 family)